MKLFKLIVELRYPQQKPDIFNFRERIISAVGKGNKQIPPNISDGFQFLIKEKLIKVIVESSRVGADMILPDNVPHPDRYAYDNMAKLYKQLNSILEIQKVERVGVRGVWIKKVNIDMEDLVQRFKERFYKENKIVASAKDIALVFTLQDEERLINYNAGPMSKEQLAIMINQESRQYGNDRIDVVNSSGIFFDYDYYLAKTTRFDLNFLIKFMDKALKKSKEAFSETLNILEGKND